jgi:hypothetical protein
MSRRKLNVPNPNFPPMELAELKPGCTYILRLPPDCPMSGYEAINTYLKTWGESLGIKFLLVGSGIEFLDSCADFLASPQFKSAVRDLINDATAKPA